MDVIKKQIYKTQKLIRLFTNKISYTLNKLTMRSQVLDNVE